MSRSVGEFTLVGHLGEGSFATVFLARHRESGRDFAMKAISRSRLQGKLQENLESEISILKSFKHVNIVELHDIKKTERHIYLVLEYCRGGDLRALIRRERRLAEPTVRHFMRHLGAGLRFLWSKNLVHRDLKPQNLLLSNLGLDATLKIADFGFARHLAKASMAETICGSPLYMAPEILQGQKYGAKADLWSVGAILYEMLAGRPPFGGANQIQLLANIRRGPTPPPREGFYPLPEDVPRPGRACSELLCRLLVPDPQYRASFGEFFRSDVVRLFLTDSAGIGAPAAEARRDSLTRSPRGGGQRGAVGVSATARVAGGDSRVQDLPASPGGIARSGHGQQQQQQQQHRVSVNELRGVDVQRSPRERGQGRGSWWPLTGWRWGGDGGQQDDPGSRGRGGEDDPRFARLTRTFSDPPAIAHHHQHSRSQTRSGRDGGGGDAYVYQQGSAARLSRGQIAAAQAQTGPSRPPLTPPSPAHGPVASRRYRAGGALPISIRQHQNPTRRRSESMGGYGSEGRGYDDRDTIRRQDTWSPSETGRADHPSSPWPRSDGGSPTDHRVGGGDVVPLPSRERPRLHSHGPNSAPEMSYMGHAASRARERAAAAAAAAAAGLRGVAFSLAGDRTGAFTSPAGSAREMPPPVAQLATPRKGGASGSTVVEEISSSGRPSRSPSLDLGARTPTDAAPRGAPVGQLAVTHSHPAAAAAAAGSLQVLGSISPESYPLQVAAMVSAQRQRLWVGAGGVVMPAPGDSAIVVGGNVSGSGLSYASDVLAESEAGSGAGLGLGAGVRAGVFTPRLEQRESVAQRMQQQQQGVGEGDNRASESGDGSGGSDDFVMVDGTSSDYVGSPGAGGGGGVRREEMRDAHGAYRIGAPEGEVRGGDASSLGSRLVAAGGRRDRGRSGQAEFGLQPGGAGAVRAAVGEAQGRGEGGRPVPALSLEAVMRCLQVVELFGRRAVLIAQLGDSRLDSATQRRWRESLDAQEKAGAGGNTWSDAGSLAPVESFAQGPESDIGAFAKDDSLKPSLFTDRDNSWLLSSSSARAPSADPTFRTAPSSLGVGIGVGYRAGGINATSSVTGGDATTGCDSHRLFGEALVLYLKSLSMAKEAIVWGKQALESLPDASAASSMPRNPPATPPPSSPSGKPRAPFALPHSHSPQRRDVSSSGGGIMIRGERSRTPLNQHLHLQQSQQRPDPGDSGIDPLRSRESGRVGTDGVTSSSSGSAGAGRGGVDVTAMGLVPSEAQVAAHGALLVGWLTGQFSTVLKRAEKCKLELRGSVTASSPTAGAETGSEQGSDVGRRDAPISSTPSYSPSSSSSMATTGSSLAAGDSRKTLVAGSGTAVTPTPPSPGEARHSNPHARGPPAGGGLSPKEDHGAAPEAVAISARDIVVRAALAQEQDSKASEVLGMWETARKGYEKAAILLETLFLDALVARPEASTGLPYTSVGALGRSGTVSPRSGSASGMGVVSSGGSATLVSGVEGALSEADQRILQMYMTRFARRAVEVAGMEREEARLTARGASAGSTERQGERGQEAVAPPGRRSGGEGEKMSGLNTHTRAPARDSHNVVD